MPSGLILPQPSYTKTLLSVLVAIGIFVLGVAADNWLAISGWLAWFDEAGAALVIGILIYLFERHRERALRERLNTIALMNHHVRNALQVLAYSSYERD